MSTIYDTIEDQIEDETEESMGYRKLHKYVKISDVESKSLLVVPLTSITSEYRHFLEDHIVEVELDDEEYAFFRHNPQAVSNEVYETVQYWGLILELNHCKSRIDFDKRVIKVYDSRKQNRYISFSYDEESNLTQVTTTINSCYYTLEYENNLTKINEQVEEKIRPLIEFSYNEFYLLSEITTPLTNDITKLEYDNTEV